MRWNVILNTVAMASLLGITAPTVLAQTECPNPEGGDCCTPTPGIPGCNDTACCTIVCDNDSYCCDSEWDESCVKYADTLCNGCGGGGGGGGSAENDGCDAAIEIYLGDNAVTTIGATTNGPEDCDFFGNPQTWNDVWYTFTPENTAVLTVSTCDIVDWDSKLVAYTGGCGVLSWEACNDDGDGCTGYTSIMTVTVIADTEYLIRVGSYSATGSGSGTMNLSMGEPCVTDCPKGGLAEGEPCGADTNGGCNLDPSGESGTEAIMIGDTICGTYWYDGTNRDTDWYEFTLDESMIVTASLSGDVTASADLFLLTEHCDPITVAVGEGVCPSVATSNCIAAGTYRVFVAPGLEALFDCDSETANYVLQLSGEACELPPSPPNDLCQDAIEIAEGVHEYTNNFALTDGPTTPNCAGYGSVSVWNDVWYTWTATMSGLCEVSTCDTVDYDSKMAAYDGGCANMHEVGCNDDGAGCAGFTSIMVFPCDEGVEYLIRIGGYAEDATGSGTFALSAREPCDYEPPSGAIYEAEACGEDLNGGCNDASGSNPTEPINFGDTLAGSWFFDGALRDTDWYSIEVPSPGAEVTLELRNFDSVAGNVFFLAADCAAAFDAATGGCPATLTSMCSLPGTYWIVVAPGFDTVIDCNDPVTSQYLLTVSMVECEATPPDNDYCADAIEITDGNTDFETIFASTDGDPDCDFAGNAQSYNDIWFRYVATCTDTLTMSTCNIVDFDSKIVLYEDDGQCPPATWVACNDDGTGCAGYSSLLTAEVVEGQSYLIRVGGYTDGGWGAGTLTVGCALPGGCDDYFNNCESPEDIPGPGDYEINTLCAYEAGDRNVDLTGYCDPGTFGDDIVDNCYFLRLTPSTSGEWSFSTCNQAFYDTNLAILQDDCIVANVVACLDDTEGCEGFSTTLITDLVGGQTYIICVGGYGATSFGQTTLTITGDDAPPECPGDFNDDGTINGFDLTILLGAWGGPDGDIDGDGNTDGYDLTLMLGDWGLCP